MLIALAARASAAPTEQVAEAVRYANALTGVEGDDEADEEVDEEVAQRAPDDPDDQLAGSASSDDDDEASELDDAGEVDDAAEARAETDGGAEIARSMAIDDDDDLELVGEDTGRDDHAGELAMLDDEPANAVAITSDDAGYAAPAAGAAERYEQRMRRRRSWILGRLDVGLAWRQRQIEPMRSVAYVSNEVWLLATWRR